MPLRCVFVHGNGHGRPEKSTGPPRPASASRRLIITAIAASSLPSVLLAWLCGTSVRPKRKNERNFKSFITFTLTMLWADDFIVPHVVVTGKCSVYSLWWWSSCCSTIWTYCRSCSSSSAAVGSPGGTCPGRGCRGYTGRRSK